MNKYKRGFAHIAFIAIGVVVLLVAVGATVALVKRNGGTKEGTPVVQNNVPQNQTSDWKTYTNNEMGFSFGYPTSWGDIREDSNLGYYDWYKNTDNPSNQCINFFLSAQNFGRNSQFVNFFKSEPCPAPRDGGYFESSWIKDQKIIESYCANLTPVTFIDGCSVTKNKNGVTLARVSYKDVPKMDSDTGFGPHIFYFMYSPISSRGMAFVAKPENVEVMDKVVDSLRFTPIPMNLGPNWKKYQSEKYGFELSYPSTWVIRTDPQLEAWVGFSPADKYDDSPTGGGVKVEDNTRNLTLSSLFDEVKNISYYHSFEFFSVGGEQAFRYRSNEFAATRAVVVHGGKIYTLGNEIVTNAKILSSFKFTDTPNKTSSLELLAPTNQIWPVRSRQILKLSVPLLSLPRVTEKSVYSLFAEGQDGLQTFLLIINQPVTSEKELSFIVPTIVQALYPGQNSYPMKPGKYKITLHVTDGCPDENFCLPGQQTRLVEATGDWFITISTNPS